MSIFDADALHAALVSGKVRAEFAGSHWIAIEQGDEEDTPATVAHDGLEWSVVFDAVERGLVEVVQTMPGAMLRPLEVPSFDVTVEAVRVGLQGATAEGGSL